MDEAEDEKELNEMREIAGIQTHVVYKEKDQLLKDYLAKAGL